MRNKAAKNLSRGVIYTFTTIFMWYVTQNEEKRNQMSTYVFLSQISELECITKKCRN